MGAGVRKIKLSDIVPDCEIYINEEIYDIVMLVKNKKVIDIGCGSGWTKKIVEESGGEWVGVEPFTTDPSIIKASAENLPFEDNTFDVAIMHAVLQHIPDVSKAFKEVSRILSPGGILVGYSAFMECFHEISYSHLSFKAIEYYAQSNGMKLEKISGGKAFGIDYHLMVLLYPLKINWLRKAIAALIRTIFKIKSKFAYLLLRYKRKYNKQKAKQMAELYFKIECLRQSVGFSFVIRKLH
jgi:ubiquinone/menaquinone biosynthesis C-methylase UbiE